MFHMLSCFDLKPGVALDEFDLCYSEFVRQMRGIDLVASSEPIGVRQSDTPMDTDNAHDHDFFVLMSFRDRAQVDAAYAHILQHMEPGDAAHDSVYSKVANPVFICWQDRRDLV